LQILHNMRDTYLIWSSLVQLLINELLIKKILYRK